MSGIENVQSSPEAADPHRMGGLAPKNHAKRRRSAKEDDAKQKLHGRLMNWMLQERDKQGPNRYEMATDEDFYDGIQWSDEEILALHERGQAPLVYNQIKPTINWLLGTERRTRIDGKVLPREESDEEGAEVKTKLLKYLSDANHTAFARSDSFKSQIVAGVGWMENAISTDPTQEMLVTRAVDWKNIYHDSNSKELDLSDYRYIFRWSHVDLDVAQALVPDHGELLKAAALNDSQVAGDEDNPHYYLGERVNNSSNGDYASVSRRGMGSTDGNNARERVKLIECWYKVPRACKICRSDEPEAKHLTGEEWDATNQEMASLKAQGLLSVVGHVLMEMRVALMTENRLLYEDKSPYKHNRFPFTPAWCYRRARDGMPYGVVRDIRDAQIDYNKRASKALYILSTVRVIMEDGAVDDVDDLRAEVARPDAVIVKKRNSELVIDQDNQLAEQHLKLMMVNGQIIRDVGGVTDQNLGKDTKDLSGNAIGKLQDQGTIVTAVIFDQKRLAVQQENEIQLSLLEQFYTAKKVVRIIGENKPVEWLKINVYDEAAGKFLNDITRSKADFIVSEQDFKASMRQAMFESMMDLVGKLPPEVGLSLLDMVIDFADVPNKEEIVSRIRKINGQADPSRKPTPEETAAIAAKQQKAAELEKLNEDMLRAQLAKMQADTQNVNATAQKSAADTQRIVADAVEKGVRAAYQALQAGQIVGQMPGTAAVADAILAGAGYVDKGGTDPNLPAPDMAMQPTLPLAPPPQAGAPLPELQQADGAAAGIETPVADGII